MSKWQPIETAPNNTVVLVCGGTLIPEIAPNRPVRTPVKARFLNGCWSVEDIDTYGIVVDNPTHWMPLPEPPGEEKEQMGHTTHKCLIITCYDSLRLDRFTKLCIELGVAHSCNFALINGGMTLFVAPSGSKTGWPENEEHIQSLDTIKDALRKSRYPDGSNPYEWCEVHYGSDDGKAIVMDSEWEDTKEGE